MKTRFTRKEHIDSGLAFILLLLLAGLFWKTIVPYKVAVFAILGLMIKPNMFYPFSFIWLNGSTILGRIMSKVLLTIIYGLVVIPIAFFRKLSGKDSLKLKEFKKSDNSVFTERNHTFSKDDLMKPY